jgi:tetratricopeptide (TPR) repeat protein
MGDRVTAIKFFNQAVTAVNDRTSTVNMTHAYQLFAAACSADPTYGQGWFQYGNNQSDLNMHHAAVAAYRRALDCENDKTERAKIYCNIGWRLYTIGHVEEAHAALTKAIELGPEIPAAWINMAQVHLIRDEYDKACECAQKGYDLEPDNPTNEVQLAFCRLYNREFVEGFKHFEVRFKWKLHQYLQYPYPKWEGESGKTVFLVADQGLGDTLSFARFIRATCQRSKYVHAYVQRELLRLFTHSFMDVKNLNLVPFGGPSFPHADAWTTMVSLPYALKLTNEEIRNTPHITPPRMGMTTNWLVPDQKLHIGIAWRGSHLNEINNHRSIPLQHFLELYRVPGIQLYGLQVGEHSQEANNAGAVALVRDVTPYISDVVDTLSIIRHLDLIITCESALGHIAALADRECWIPYSYFGRDYRIGDTSDMLWTPKHSIFRQDETADWAPVFRVIEKHLLERVQTKKAA